MTFEEDVSLWGKVVAASVGTAGLLAGVLGVGRTWIRKDLDGRMSAVEGNVKDIKKQLLTMQQQVLDNSRETMQATAQMTLQAERMEAQGEQLTANVDRLLSSHEGVTEAIRNFERQVGMLEQEVHG